MFDNAIKVLNGILANDIQPNLKRCHELKENVTDPATKKRLDEKYSELDAQVWRAGVCLEILAGHAFTLNDEVAGLRVVLPSNIKSAALVEEVEKLGGRVENYG